MENNFKRKNRFVFFANYFDVTISVILAFVFLVVFFSNIYEAEYANNYDYMYIAGFWAIELYFSMLIVNKGRLISSFFAIPVKAIFSVIFFFAFACLSEAIFNREGLPMSERIYKGVFSGFAIWFLNKLVNPNKK